MEKNSFRKVITSRINREELIKNPELYNALENDKIIRLDFLSPVKPNLIDTKGFKNEKKKNMVEDINSFKQIYYKDYMTNKNSLDKIYKISNENNIFLNHFSGFNKYYDNKNQREILNEIQLKYKKKNGFSPRIKEKGNLFNNSILLQSDKDLKQYISLDLETIRNDSHSLSFLKNVKNKIQKNSKYKMNNNNLLLEKIKNGEINDKTEKENDLFNIRKNIKKYNSERYEKIKYESINDLKRDIKNTKDCFNLIDKLNNFLNTNNQNNINYIDKLKSRKSSGEATTRMNSGIKKLNIKLKINDDNNNFFKINNGINKNNLVKINNTLDYIPNNYNNNDNNILKNNESLILPMINTNNNYNYKQDLKNNLINSTEREIIEDINKLILPKEKDFNTEKKKINYNKKNYNSINSTKKSKIKKKIALRKPNNALEKLYEKISKTENYIEYNKEIKNYLKKNNYDVNNNIDSDDLYKSVDQSRKKITDTSTIQKNYDIMVNNKLKSLEQNKEMILHNNKIKQKIENIEERMIGLLCEVK